MKRSSILEKRRQQVKPEARASVSLSFRIVDRIHEILEEKELKQKDLADRLGKSEAEISKWMRGTHNFTIDTLASIEAALGAPILQVYHSQAYPPYEEEPMAVAEGEGEYNANIRLGFRDKLSYSITTRVGKLFFDLINNAHSEYLKITQSKRIRNDEFQRNDIFLDRSELQLFRDAIDKAIIYWERDMGQLKENNSSNTHTLEERRKEHGSAYEKWNEEADALLGRLFDEGHSLHELSEMFERSVGSIRSRLNVIGKI
ncbi:MAG: helix-turn-helix domain-containing protein [Prevotella sp.]|nr:helix-turn-helix domain-containing protein [Prevotella sp.]